MSSLTRDAILFAKHDRAEARKLQRAVASGDAVRLADGIYAVPERRSIEELVYNAWAPILAHVAPDAVLAGRTGMDSRPYRDVGRDGLPVYPGWVFATHSTGAARKRLSLPGLEIRSSPGAAPLRGDLPYLGVRLPSDARKLLENLRPSRSRQGPSATVGREAVELAVERLLSREGEEGLRKVRKHADEIAPALGSEAELEILKEIIGAVAGTRKAKLSSPMVAARRRVPDPYDPDCMERLRLLATTLERAAHAEAPDPHLGERGRTCASFVEAYFTNYIEGTRFLVDKARRIVFDREDPDGRPADGRDVTQTFSQLSAFTAGDALPTGFGEFIDEIQERNRALLDARPEMAPGQFKTEPNSAGNTVFVAPEHVRGTLKEGFAMLGGLGTPFARGAFLHTLLVLVHPFNDGNGRTSRIMMTKALVGGGTSRIVVPTVFRNDYIGGLRALTHQTGPQAAPLVRALLRAQAVTSRIASSDLDETIRIWASTYAFIEDERNARLEMPDAEAEIEWRRGIPAPASYWRDLDLEVGSDDAASSFRT